MSLYDGVDLDATSTKASGNPVSNTSSNSIAASSIKFLESQLLLKKAALQQSKLNTVKSNPTSRPSKFSATPTTLLEATSQLPQSEFNSNKIENEYDPLFPNDYEKVKAIQSMEAAKLAAQNANPFQATFSNTVGVRSQLPPPVEHRNFEPEVESTTRRGFGAAIPPPSSTANPQTAAESTDATQVAQKIMAKFGYKAGLGLGRAEQGIASPLQVEKTGLRTGKAFVEPSFPPMAFTPSSTPAVPTSVKSLTTELLRNQTKVLLLRNMVGPGEVDTDLEGEVREECRKYGEVTNCIIYEIPNSPEDEAVRIFVEFAKIEQAVKAVVDLNGRFFGGRCVSASFYNLDKFRKLQLAD